MIRDWTILKLQEVIMNIPQQSIWLALLRTNTRLEKYYHHHQNAVWDNERKSKHIESILLEMPIMPFVAYLSKEDTKIEIIDGSNRIEALVDYCFDDLQLCGLEILTSLNGTKFSDLPTWIKGKLLGKWIKFYLMASEQHDIHIDIYYIYNTIQDWKRKF